MLSSTAEHCAAQCLGIITVQDALRATNSKGKKKTVLGGNSPIFPITSQRFMIGYTSLEKRLLCSSNVKRSYPKHGNWHHKIKYRHPRYHFLKQSAIKNRVVLSCQT